MTAQKHTPGPWEARNGTDVYPVGDMDARHFIADCDPDNAPINNDGGHPWTDVDYAEAKANARLIAAAPEMLEALKMLRDADDVAAREGYSGTMGADQRAAVDAAIAKATGQ